MFENTFKNVDDILHKDAGCSSELDYVEQSSWVLFLKYLEDLEKSRALAKELAGEKYKPIIADKFRWTTWACPKTKDGKIDFNKALSGDDLRDFVNGELFPYLAKFKVAASGSDTLEYKIGEIFSEITNKIQSGYNLREILELVESSEFGKDAAEVGDVVPAVPKRRLVDRWQPERVDTEPLQVVELRQETLQVARSVTVAVDERAHHDLVEHRAPIPPRVEGEARQLDRGGKAHGAPFQSDRRHVKQRERGSSTSLGSRSKGL